MLGGSLGRGRLRQQREFTVMAECNGGVGGIFARLNWTRKSHNTGMLVGHLGNKMAGRVGLGRRKKLK